MCHFVSFNVGIFLNDIKVEPWERYFEIFFKKWQGYDCHLGEEDAVERTSILIHYSYFGLYSTVPFRDCRLVVHIDCRTCWISGEHVNWLQWLGIHVVYTVCAAVALKLAYPFSCRSQTTNAILLRSSLCMCIMLWYEYDLCKLGAKLLTYKICNTMQWHTAGLQKL